MVFTWNTHTNTLKHIEGMCVHIWKKKSLVQRVFIWQILQCCIILIRPSSHSNSHYVRSSLKIYKYILLFQTFPRLEKPWSDYWTDVTTAPDAGIYPWLSVFCLKGTMGMKVWDRERTGRKFIVNWKDWHTSGRIGSLAFMNLS